MTRFFYTLLLRVLAPGIWLWMRIRAGKQAKAWKILARDRFGYSPSRIPPFDPQASIWVHAISLGETRAAQPLLHALLKQGFSLLLTHTTPTGQAEGKRLFAEAISQGQLHQTWLPYDFPGATRRFFNRFQPRCGLLIEREVWPNLIHAAKQANVPLLLVNARLSQESARYARWGGQVLRHAYASLNLVLAQTQADAQRLQTVGTQTPYVTGNLKFEVQLPSSQLNAGKAFKQALNRPIVAIASTREGEDDLFLQALQQMLTGHLSPELKTLTASSAQDNALQALYILIPRHPQRFEAAAALLQKYGVPFTRRSALQSLTAPSATTTLLLGDSLGEMAFYFAAADVAIIGGGFAPLGGQNLIEACAAGTPVIVGPHMFNFEQATEDAIAANAAIRVANPKEALQSAHALLQDAPRHTAMQAAALRWTHLHRGATQRSLDALQPWLLPKN